MLSRSVTWMRLGVERILLRAGILLAKLLPTKDRVPGLLRGKISYTPDAFDPLTDQELEDLGFE
jgi:hypothetical protein